MNCSNGTGSCCHGCGQKKLADQLSAKNEAMNARINDLVERADKIMPTNKKAADQIIQQIRQLDEERREICCRLWKITPNTARISCTGVSCQPATPPATASKKALSPVAERTKSFAKKNTCGCMACVRARVRYRKALTNPRVKHLQSRLAEIDAIRSCIDQQISIGQFAERLTKTLQGNYCKERPAADSVFTKRLDQLNAEETIIRSKLANLKPDRLVHPELYDHTCHGMAAAQRLRRA